MAESKLFTFTFNMDEEHKSLILQKYNQETFSAEDEKLLASIRNSSAPNKEQAEKDLLFAHAFVRSVAEDGKYSQQDGENPVNQNNVELKQDRHGNLRLLCMMRNLEGTGLNFTIEDGKSIVLAQNGEMSREKLMALFNFLDTHYISDVKLPDNLRDLTLAPTADDNSPNVGTYWDKLQQESESFAEQNEMSGQVKLGAGKSENIEPDISPSENIDPDMSPLANSGGAFYKDDNKPLNLSAKVMRDKVEARLGIMGYNNGVIKTKSLWFGNGYIVSAYKDDDAYKNDGKNEKGKIKHTKDFSIKVQIKKGRPTVSWYIPQGGKIETKHAQAMLDALKATGAKYFTLPSAVKVSGGAQNCFWEGCGKTLMVPRCKCADCPEGVELGPDNVQTMFNVIEKDNNKDSDSVLEFKARLLDELEYQEAYKRSKNKNYKTNSVLATQMEQMRGTLVYKKLNDGYLNNLSSNIMKMANKGLSSKTKNEGWDFIEVQAANRAMVSLIEKLNEKDDNGNFKYRYIGLPEQDKALDKIFAKMMEEEKKNIAEEFQLGLSDGKREKDIKNEIRGTTKGLIETTHDSIETDYGIKLNMSSKGVNVSSNVDIKKYYPDAKVKKDGKGHLEYDFSGCSYKRTTSRSHTGEVQQLGGNVNRITSRER